jgi:hypothetical protein
VRGDVYLDQTRTDRQSYNIAQIVYQSRSQHPAMYCISIRNRLRTKRLHISSSSDLFYIVRLVGATRIVYRVGIVLS